MVLSIYAFVDRKKTLDRCVQINVLNAAGSALFLYESCPSILLYVIKPKLSACKNTAAS